MKKDLFGELKLPLAFTDGDEAEIVASVHNDADREGADRGHAQDHDRRQERRGEEDASTSRRKGIQELVVQDVDSPARRTAADAKAAK